MSTEVLAQINKYRWLNQIDPSINSSIGEFKRDLRHRTTKQMPDLWNPTLICRSIHGTFVLYLQLAEPLFVLCYKPEDWSFRGDVLAISLSLQSGDNPLSAFLNQLLSIC